MPGSVCTDCWMDIKDFDYASHAFIRDHPLDVDVATTLGSVLEDQDAGLDTLSNAVMVQGLTLPTVLKPGDKIGLFGMGTESRSRSVILAMAYFEIMHAYLKEPKFLDTATKERMLAGFRMQTMTMRYRYMKSSWMRFIWMLIK